ncbi:MAG TPA: hypothetical protein PKI36_03225 [Turneriella sp.]|nr:hypothetical protein [Turneriella sp.]
MDAITQVKVAGPSRKVSSGQIVILMIVSAAFSRVIPHMPNFSPLNAIALFAAAHLSARWQAYVVPLAATWLSDLFLNNVLYAVPGSHFAWSYDGAIWQYASYILIVTWGWLLFLSGTSWRRTLVGAAGSGLIFFIVSNFGVWVSGGLYPANLAGLLAAYTAALPFYQGTLLGDVFYMTGLFGGYAVLQGFLLRRRLAMGAG